ncbi:cysteate synthase [Magnetovibrio sp. PR-2]|uniref:cysteate synthase n=1 Tax=Magnetovibrio sp. PR-2 TaxID=3120356 RepID=UPI002FCE2FBB
MTQYRLQCQHPDCKAVYDDTDSYRLFCDNELNHKHGPALLRPVYDDTHLRVDLNLPGILKFRNWLPIGDANLSSTGVSLGAPLTYKSYALADYLGLNHLHISFSGYWPQRGANLVTRSFKEFESQASVLRYIDTSQKKTLPPMIIASAGNTANSFALLSHHLQIPIVLVVPERGLDNLILPFQTSPKLICVNGDYSDAIELAGALSKRLNLIQDGGVRNVARRSGMGTVMLNAVANPVEGTSRLFKHYFQAVGSASGALGAWEASELLRKDGRFGDTITTIHLAQNEPFTPIVDAVNAGSDTLLDCDDETARTRIAAVTASVLTNRNPPYSFAGGIHDMLKATDGTAWGISNEELYQASRIFNALEGIDIGPAGAVATAALIKAIVSEAVQPNDDILLHITGGGRAIQSIDGNAHHIQPSIRVNPDQVDEAMNVIEGDIR